MSVDLPAVGEAGPGYATKINAAITAIDAGLAQEVASAVHLAGAEEVTGAKTFDAGALLDKGNGVLNVKAAGFGAFGTGIADDTAAIQAAIDYAAAHNIRLIFFPDGRYRITSTLNVTTKGVKFVGERQGRIDVYGGSQIEANFNGVLVQLGTDNGHAYDAADYDGSAEGFGAFDIGFKATGTTTTLENGSQTYCAGTTAIKDWRGGSVTLERVWFEHFDYTFWGIQSDFNHFTDVNEWYCHSGMYLGPRSDQAIVDGLLVKLCDRGVDVDGAWQATFNELRVVDSGSASTNPVRVRSQWSRGSVGITFNDPWFEVLATTVNVEAPIELGIGDSVQSTDISINRPILLSNDQVTTPHFQFFVKTDNVDRVLVDVAHGGNISNLTRFARNVGTVSPGMHVRTMSSLTLRAQNDSTGVLDFNLQSHANGITRFDREVNGAPVLRVGKRGESVARWSFLSTGLLQLSDGASASDLSLSRLAAHTFGVGAGDAISTGLASTGSRPAASSFPAGAQYFDSTLNQPIWSTGTIWVDALGFPVDNDALVADFITTGEETIPRAFVASTALTMTSQVLRLCYFTARKSETITQVTTDTGGTAAGSTPTLVRVGVWTTDSTGALLSQVSTTPNDTTLLASQFTTYTKSFSASFSKVAGQRYAVGALVVTAATAPTILGGPTSLNNGHVNRAPRLAAQVTGQSDLPSTVVAGSLSSTNNRPYFVLLP